MLWRESQLICCYSERGNLISELESRLPHSGPIFKNDDGAVHMKIEETTRGTSVDSIIKSFSRRNDVHGSFKLLLVIMMVKSSVDQSQIKG